MLGRTYWTHTVATNQGNLKLRSTISPIPPPQVCPAIEVCGSRLAAPPFLPPPQGAWLSVADQASHGHLVVAEQHRLSPAEWSAMATHGLHHYPVVVSVDGREVSRGDGTAVLGNPLHALAWLVNSVMRQQGQGSEGEGGQDVREGQVITTGTMTGLAPVTSGVMSSPGRSVGAAAATALKGAPAAVDAAEQPARQGQQGVVRVSAAFSGVGLVKATLHGL